MKKTSKLSRFFKFLWMESDDYPFCQEWDDLLNALIDKGKISAVGAYTATFNDKYVVWIENHPYASGQFYYVKENEKLARPKSQLACSKATKIRLEDCVNGFLEEQRNKPTPLIEEIKNDAFWMRSTGGFDKRIVAEEKK